MANFRQLLKPESYYHLYSRANGDDRLFLDEIDYCLFLKNYFSYSNIIFDTFCFCLMPNHFHFLIRVKPLEQLSSLTISFKSEKDLSNLMAQHIGNFLNWYAKYFNFKYSRKGSLFINTFNRKQITTQEQLITTACYIHANPIKANLCNELEEWKFSSYRDLTIYSRFGNKLNEDEIIEWFDGINNLIFVHKSHLLNHSSL